MKRDIKKLNDAFTIDVTGQSQYMREPVLDLLKSIIPKEKNTYIPSNTDNQNNT